MGEGGEPEPEPDYTAVIEAFKTTGQVPLAWQWMARNLIGAANRLHQDRERISKAGVSDRADKLFLDSHAAILLLYGLALENLLKALLVAKGVDATSTGVLNNKLKTHNVLRLWQEAGLDAGEARRDLLKRLHYSIEAGKYPVGTKPDADAPSPVWLALTSAPEVGELLTIVEDALRAQLPKGVFERADLLKLCIDSDNAGGSSVM